MHGPLISIFVSFWLMTIWLGFSFSYSSVTMMEMIAELREKYDLHMKVERFLSEEAGIPESDQAFIRE